MEALSSLTVLIAGLALLWLAGDKTVRFAIELSDLMGVSSFIVGFLIMSVSTGLPEILTAVFSGIGDVAGLSAGNIMGASFINLSLILGASVLAAGTLPIKPDDEKMLLKTLFIVMIFASLLLITRRLTVWHGLLLILAYVVSVRVLHKGGIIEKIVKEEEKEGEKELERDTFLTSTRGTFVKLLGSLALVILGAKITVDSAVELGIAMGFPLETIGATIVALGTTLPELTLGINAVKNREYALTLGNLFGSTLVNLTLVMGLLSVISPTTIFVVPLIGTVIYFMLTLGFIWYVMSHEHRFGREHALILLAMFVLFIVEEIGVASLF